MRPCLCALLALTACGTSRPEPPDPGSVTLHRLNRSELDRTVRHLFDVDHPVVLDLPSDDVGNGFDNQADVLSLSPLHIEQLDGTLFQMLQYDVLPSPLPQTVKRFEAEGDEVSATVGAASGEVWTLWSNGTLSARAQASHPGTYSMSAYIRGSQAGDDPVRVRLDHDGLDPIEIDVPWSGLQLVTVDWHLPRGVHTLNISFLNDYYDPQAGHDRNLYVDWLELTGPIDAMGPRPPGYAKVFTCAPSPAEEPACATQIAADLGLRAWRRPLTHSELGPLVDLYLAARAQGEDPEHAVTWLVRGMLLSSNFLFRVELDPDLNDDTPHALSDFELATRLSYFLWSSTPDSELLVRAGDGRLNNDDELREQVQRMLADPRANALVEGLGAQWLSVDAVQDAFPEPTAYPEWTPRLRDSLAEEMRRQVARVMLDDHSMHELLTGDTTFINDVLAVHYGLSAPELSEAIDLTGDAGWSETSLAGTERMGLLTTGGWLTTTSYPGRTSPVRRGKWVLDNLLCESPPPPPPGVEALDRPDRTKGLPPSDLHHILTQHTTPQSVRQRLAIHRDDPTCNSCHQSIDPVGFAFENFDAIGAWRNTDGGAAVDASGRLPDGFAFEGAPALIDYLAQSRKFDRCVIQKTMTWALGRAPVVSDLPYLDAIEADYVASERRFAGLITAIVLSDPFRMRRVSPPPTTTAGVPHE